MIKVAYIDVDDILIRTCGSKRIPIPATLVEVQRLHAEGWELYCWSSVGAEYARRSAAEIGLAHCFTAFLPKPTLMIDDIAPQGWPGLEMIHPNEIGNS